MTDMTRGARKQARYARTPKGLASHRRAQATYRLKNRDKRKAYQLVRTALSNGTLTKSSVCNRCGTDKLAVEASHDDYSKPLEVEWLCRPCHMRKDGQAR